MNTPPPVLDDILTPARITSMRTHILDRVSPDIVRRRTTTHRRRAVISAAAAAIIVGIGAIAGTAAYQSSDSTGHIAASDQPVNALTAPAPAISSPTDRGLTENGGPDVSDGRQVITTGAITLTTGNTHESAAQLMAWVISHGGRVDSWSETGTDRPSASVTIRVPADQITATTDTISTFGVVDDIDINRTDVTGTVKDLDARITALNISVDRLTNILRDADTSAQIIDAEQALTQRQEQLESLQSQRASTAEQVSLATLTVTMHSAEPAADDDGLSGAFADGWNSITDTTRWIIRALATTLPWLTLATLAIGGYWTVRRLHAARARR